MITENKPGLNDPSGFINMLLVRRISVAMCSQTNCAGVLVVGAI